MAGGDRRAGRAPGRRLGGTRPAPGGSPASGGARAAAVRRLQRVEEEGAYVARLGGGLSAEDERLAADLVAGVTRLRRRLDFQLTPFVRGGLARLDTPVLQALRVGLYDLLVRGTPPHAAVGLAVDAAREASHEGGAAVVNGVLRAFLRDMAGEAARPATGDAAEDLATWHSYPTWLVRRWLERYGPEETEALLEAGNAPPAFGLRANPLRGTSADLAERVASLGVEAGPSRWTDEVIVVRRLQTILRAGLMEEGLASVQDEAAALVVHVLDPRPGDAVLDAAAAPGGKALHAAERMRNSGRLVALDAHAGRLALLERAALAHGVSIVETVAADLRKAARRPALARSFDRVLLDAPCSGTGVLGRRADLRWNRSEDDLAGLVALQDELLDAAAGAVAPGGLLVYSTCSIEPEENQQRVAAFLARHTDFARDDVDGLVPPAMRTQDGDYAALPHVHDTDGAYAARLRHLG